jgi:ribosomal protein S18 acetylase RimI-like enzyme
MDILRATHADAVELKAVAVAAKAHWGYPAEWMARWTNWITVSPDFLDRFEVYKLVEAGQILGWCALLLPGHHAHLEDLWVRPDRIGTGLGRRLFEYAVTRARASGATHLDLDADPNAVGFYQHMGMVITGQRKAEIDRTIPMMVLVLSLRHE